MQNVIFPRRKKVRNCTTLIIKGIEIIFCKNHTSGDRIGTIYSNTDVSVIVVEKKLVKSDVFSFPMFGLLRAINTFSFVCLYSQKSINGETLLMYRIVQFFFR